MITSFAGASANETWLKATKALLAAPPQSGRGGQTNELLHVGLSIENCVDRWVSVRRPPINPAFPLVEAIWILGGQRDSATPTFWNPALPRYAGEGDEFHGAYGWRLRKQFGLDQIARAVAALRSNRDSRQVLLQIWDPRSDFPAPNGAPAADDIPCNTSSHLKVRAGKLEWLQVMRSNDIFLGTPNNIVQFSILQEILAARLGLATGSYNVIVDSLHAYDRDIAQLRESVEVPSPKLPPAPLFGVPERFWDDTLLRLTTLVETVRTAGQQGHMHAALTSSADLPADWPSAFAIVVADAARRRGWIDLTDEAIELCANGCLKHLWNSWYSRVTDRGIATPLPRTRAAT